MDASYRLTPPISPSPAPPGSGDGGKSCLILLTKPPLEHALSIDHRRRLLNLDRSYAVDRLHSTLLPLGREELIEDVVIEVIREAMTSLALECEPFSVSFDRLRGNALVSGQGMRHLREFQKRLVARLAAYGICVPDYVFRPHLSLVYGQPQNRNIEIAPIGWTVMEFLLIRSVVGKGRHELIDSWQLHRRQGELPF